jgi:hypothetical protein
VLKLPRLPLAFSIALLAPVLTAQTGAAPDVNTKRKQPNGRLELAGSLVVKSELAESFVDPIKCDDDGNVYLMTQIEASSGIRKISPKGQRLALFSASSATDVHVWHATYFSLDQDGRVYQLADLHDKLDRAVVVYGKDGSYKSTIKLDFPPGAHDWYATQIAVFPSGDLLIAGSVHDPTKASRVPFTGIFGSDGSLKRQIVLTDDGDLEKLAESGDPRVVAPERSFSNTAVDLGRAEAADDGNVYVMRRMSPAIVYAVSPAGEVVRRFEVDSGDSDFTPISMHIGGSKIAVLFWDARSEKALLRVLDLQGRSLASYQDGAESGSGTLGLALACYSQNPERFTFLSTDENSFLEFKIAEPH